MLEVSYETPASMALAIVFGAIVCSLKENTPEEQPAAAHPHIWKSTFVLSSLCIILCALLTSKPLIQFELAFEDLTNLQDPRFSP